MITELGRVRRRRLAAALLSSLVFASLSVGPAHAADGAPASLGPAPADGGAEPEESPVLGPWPSASSPVLGPWPPADAVSPPAQAGAPHPADASPVSHNHPARSWRPGQEAWLDVPAVGLHRRIFVGGQDVIDDGVVTHYNAPGAPPMVSPGGAGVYWLAGHHSTHGAPLALATSIPVGAVVTIQLRNRAVSYRITDELRTPTQISFSTFYGPDRAAPRLLIQTCLSESRRLLLIGALVSA